MRLAVGSLVDRITLGRRLLEGGRRGPAGGVGGALPVRGVGQGVPAGGLSRPDARRADAWPATIRWWCGSRQTPAARLSHAMAAGHVVRPRHRRHDRAGGRGGQRRRRGRRPRRAADPRSQAERHALRGRGDGVPRGPQLGGDPGAPFGRHPADAREPQPGAPRQGRQDRRAAAADPDPSGAAPGPGRAGPRGGRPRRGGSPGTRDGSRGGRSGPMRSSTRSRGRARPSGR